MTDRRLTFTTTMRVIDRVHDRTADCGTEALMSCLTGFTQFDCVVFDIADLTDSSLAIQTDDADFTGEL